MAKKLTLIILSLAFLIGSVGAFVGTFNMDGYINFLKGFAPLYIALIASIGANSAVTKVQEKKNV
jgi:hypothetical protein